jgi:hypothetical protein
MLVSNAEVTVRCPDCGDTRTYKMFNKLPFEARIVGEKLTPVPCIRCNNRPYMKAIAVDCKTVSTVLHKQKVEVTKLMLRFECCKCKTVVVEPIIIASTDKVIVEKCIDKHKTCNIESCDGKMREVSRSYMP